MSRSNARSRPAVVEVRARAPQAPARVSARARSRSVAPQSAVVPPAISVIRLPDLLPRQQPAQQVCGPRRRICPRTCPPGPLPASVAGAGQPDPGEEAAIGGRHVRSGMTDASIAEPLGTGNDCRVVGLDGATVFDLDDDGIVDRERLEAAGGRGANGSLGAGPD